MIAAKVFIGVDVSRDWLDGFCFPDGWRLRLPNTAEGHDQLLMRIRDFPDEARVGFEATGGQEWALWGCLVAAGVEAVQLPPAQIKAFARSRGTRANTDRIDAELIARFMRFRPDAGRLLPNVTLRILRTLTTGRAQLVDMRKRLWAQIGEREKQGVAAEVDEMDNALIELFRTQIEEFEHRIEKQSLRRTAWQLRLVCCGQSRASVLSPSLC